MDFLALKAELTSGDAASRKEVWRSLPRGHAEHPFFSGELSKLRVLLYKEADLDVRTTGAICLEEMLHMPGAPQGESFHDWLFHSFRHTHAESKAALKRSLVLTVCDNEYVRDVHALVEVARHLPTDRYPQTVFRHVALHSPDWADVGLNHAGAICFIGRPSMFKDCSIIDHFPADLRFSIVPPAQDEAETFFRVRRNRPKAGPFMSPATQDASLRHDHAIVQRFAIRVGGRDVTVLVIAGSTSLGTLGAARWITSFEWNAERKSEYARLAGMEAPEQPTRIEAFLTVSARVHIPARPWRPENEEVELYFNKSRNLLRVPARISVATDDGSLRCADDVRYLLFDDDEVEFAGADYIAALALCVKYCLDGRSDMSIKDLLSDARLWPKGICPVKDTANAVAFFRDHLQRRSFNGIIEVAKANIRIKSGECKIVVIAAHSNSSSVTARSE